MVLVAILTADSLQVQMDIFYLFQLIASLRLLSAVTSAPLTSSPLFCGPLFFIAFEHLRVHVIKGSCHPTRAAFAVRSSTAASEAECEHRMELPSRPSMRLFALLPLLLLLLIRVARTSVPAFSSSTRTNSNLLQIGFLSSFRYGIGKNLAGAIPLAIDHINAYAVNALLPISECVELSSTTHSPDD